MKTCWRYKVIYRSLMDGDNDFMNLLNELGEDGWELVSVDNKIAYLKQQYWRNEKK